MKRFLLIISVFSILGISSYAQGDKVSINEVISHINPTKVMNTIKHLESYGTRYLLAQNRFAIANWIRDEFRSMGIQDVEMQSFSCSTYIDYASLHVDTTTTQTNVVATIPGITSGEEIYIICGHYDSFSENSSPLITAPGADDNASGTAAVIETARAIMESNYVPHATLRFICFAAEELMNFGDSGSATYAAEAAARDDDIKLVVNNDMIGNSIKNGFMNRTIGIGYAREDPWGNDIIDFAQQYTANEVSKQGYTGADLGSFTMYGYKGVYFEEINFSPYYHTTNDRWTNVDSIYVTESVKASCAVFLGLRQYITDKEDEDLPVSFNLKQNYPNPFNPSTVIEYELREESHVRISIYNLLGQLVGELVNEVKPLGSYKVLFNGNDLAGGVYFYTLQTNNYKETRKMTLLK